MSHKVMLLCLFRLWLDCVGFLKTPSLRWSHSGCSSAFCARPGVSAYRQGCAAARRGHFVEMALCSACLWDWLLSLSLLFAGSVRALEGGAPAHRCSSCGASLAHRRQAGVCPFGPS